MISREPEKKRGGVNETEILHLGAAKRVNLKVDTFLKNAI